MKPGASLKVAGASFGCFGAMRGNSAGSLREVTPAARCAAVNTALCGTSDLVKAYVRDLTLGMKKALANRDETLKVVSEQLKAPVPVLETYLLKDNDFGRDPGAAPNFPAIQKMLDIYSLMTSPRGVGRRSLERLL